jgi:hypothetical protein
MGVFAAIAWSCTPSLDRAGNTFKGIFYGFTVPYIPVLGNPKWLGYNLFA